MKNNFTLIISLSCILLISACNGGGLKVGSIEGPKMVAENSSTEFSIEAVGDTGMLYQWACDPPSAGTFTDRTSSTATFNAGLVSAHSHVKIQVTVTSDGNGPEIRMIDVKIREIGALVVGSIEGPAVVDENDMAIYSVQADGGYEVTYQWTSDPPSRGTFTNDKAATAYLHTGNVRYDTDVEIIVTVTSKNFGPVERTFDMVVREADVLVIEDIIGPVIVDENNSTEYSINAFGDTGITYQWTCEPPSAGIFTDPSSTTTLFEPVNTNADSPVTIFATAYSDNYDPEVSSIDAVIKDLPVYAWGRSWGGEESDYCYQITMDELGNSYIIGTYASTVDFDPGPGVDEHAWNGHYDIYLSKFDPAGNFLWARTWGGETNDKGLDAAVDSFGNVYVTGYFYETVDFDPGPGFDEHTTNGYRDAFLSKFDSSGNFQWAKTWGGEYYDEGRGIAIDGSDNIYITGDFEKTVDFDPGPGIDEYTSNGNEDIFLSKFDSAGNYLWACIWGGSRIDKGTCVTTDNSGNICVAGYFDKTVDFDPGPGIDEHSSINNDSDVFLSRFDSSGSFLWARTWDSYYYDGHNNKSDNIFELDESGNIYITGKFDGIVDFDPGPGVDEHTSNGRYDICLSKFNSAGDFIWAQTWGSEDSDDGYILALDGSGNIYIKGYFYDVVDFDPGPGVYEKGEDGKSGSFICKFKPSGEIVWVLTEIRSAYGMVIDDLGNIYIAGSFSGTDDFDPGSGVDEHTSIGSSDAYLIRFFPEDSY